jgi:hypothetical protein
MIRRKRDFSRKGMHRSCKKKKKQPGAGGYSQGDEMAEERRNVNHQQGKTPGRRGEEIKQEEIDKEIVRRNRLQQKNGKCS